MGKSELVVSCCVRGPTAFGVPEARMYYEGKHLVIGPALTGRSSPLGCGPAGRSWTVPGGERARMRRIRGRRLFFEQRGALPGSGMSWP